MSFTVEQIYKLLPAVYRTRDAENGYPLQALLTVIAGQTDILEENIKQLYDDQFIETCAPWAIPYIGDLIAVKPLYEVAEATYSSRAEVANTIGYRRRKGTLLGLEQVCMDVTGRPAVAVEFFKQLITCEHMKHLRPGHNANLNLRNGNQLALRDSAFNSINYTVALRRIGPRQFNGTPNTSADSSALDTHLHGSGKYNVPNIGIFLWRCKIFPVNQAPAFRIDNHRFMFSPLGQDLPLFNLLPTRDSFSRLTTRLDAPQAIGRREFYENPAKFYGQDLSVQLYADGVAIDIKQICIRDLADDLSGHWNGCTSDGKIAIDPQLGRIQFAANLKPPVQVLVNYAYGFPANLGGGAYDRSQNLSTLELASFNFHAIVSQSTTLELAVAAWNKQAANGVTGLIILPGFIQANIDLTGASAIQLPAGSRLEIVAATLDQTAGKAETSNALATLTGHVSILGLPAPQPASDNPPSPGMFIMNGLWLAGSLSVSAGGDAVNIQISDCTLVPGIKLNRNGLPAQPGEPNLNIQRPGSNLCLLNCISGPLAVAPGGMVRIINSMIDGSSRYSVAYAGTDLASPGADLHIENSTVIGKTYIHALELASNTLFLGRRAKQDPWQSALWCSRKQSGCVRFCFIPADAITPKRFKCIPDDPSQEEALQPRFVTLKYGRPAYGLLSGDTPYAIWSGADNGSQLGVYHSLQETEAVNNIQIRLNEYLPVNLEAGIFLQPGSAETAQHLNFGYGYSHTELPDDDEYELAYTGIGAHLI